MIRRFHRGGGSMARAGAALLLVAATSAGCTPTSESLMKSLTFATYEFNSGVRWGKLQQASRRLSPPLKDRYLTHTEKTDDAIRVSEVDLLRSTVNAKTKTAVLRYRYVWHRAAEGLVRRTVVVQHWKQLKNTWIVTRIEHASGKVFPLFDGLSGDKPKARRRAPATPPPRRKVRRGPPPR